MTKITLQKASEIALVQLARHEALWKEYWRKEFQDNDNQDNPDNQTNL